MGAKEEASRTLSLRGEKVISKWGEGPCKGDPNVDCGAPQSGEEGPRVVSSHSEHGLLQSYHPGSPEGSSGGR